MLMVNIAFKVTEITNYVQTYSCLTMNQIFDPTVKGYPKFNLQPYLGPHTALLFFGETNLWEVRTPTGHTVDTEIPGDYEVPNFRGSRILVQHTIWRVGGCKP